MKFWSLRFVFLTIVAGLTVCSKTLAFDTSRIPVSKNIEDTRILTPRDLKEEAYPFIQLGRALEGKRSDYWFNGYFVRSNFSACKLDGLKKSLIDLGKTSDSLADKEETVEEVLAQITQVRYEYVEAVDRLSFGCRKFGEIVVDKAKDFQDKILTYYRNHDRYESPALDPPSIRTLPTIKRVE